MKRRSFVKQAGLASLAVAAGSSLGCAAAPQYSIGLQLYTVRDEIKKEGIEKVIARISATGYRQLELYGYDKGMYFGKSNAEMAALLKENNIYSPSTHLTLKAFLYEGNDDEFKRAAEDAKAFDHKFLVIPWLDEEHRKTLDDYKKLAARLNRGAELSKDAGFQFAYHNHAFEFENFEGTTGYDILLKETDPAIVKMELDLYWVRNAGQDEHALFTANPGRFPLWHVKDMDKSDKSKQTEIGSGAIDFKKIFQDKQLSGMEYWYVEQENYSESPYKSIEQNFQYVTKELV